MFGKKHKKNSTESPTTKRRIGIRRSRLVVLLLFTLAVGASITIGLNRIYIKSSTDESCQSCHIHPEADKSWMLSKHHNSQSGVVTGCAECHLPPRGSLNYFTTKARMGLRDLWAYWTKDSASFDWASKRELDHAVTIVSNESCKRCHAQLFPSRLSKEGITAHLYYEDNEEKLDLQCISCHLDVGHYNPNYQHKKMESAPVTDTSIRYTAATPVSTFQDFTETVPSTSASFTMKAIPGGSFEMGSPDDEPFHKPDEGPTHKVTLTRFFMGETEVPWDLYWAFYNETMSEGRTPPAKVYANNSNPEADAISGPTPPFAIPDQGWGFGNRPAITMTHYAAETFCLWLSRKTGKKYRLPTEAEWEYAARGGSSTPYFFEGNPKKYSDHGFWRKFFDADTTTINRYVVYLKNSKSKTQEPSAVKANPYGLKNMLGNVLEYCSDFYAADAYAHISNGAVDPKGPSSGTEYVVRGGMYTDDAADVRCAARRSTESDKWLKTDPQNPKSIWWLSDMKGVGFRIVCEQSAVQPAPATAATSAPTTPPQRSQIKKSK